MASIQMEALPGYWLAVNLEYKVNIIFRQLADIDYSALCLGIERLKPDFNPKRH